MPPGPLVSIFTPSHDPRWLEEAYRSLEAQTYQWWEWVVVLNGEAAWAPPVDDPRVRVLPVEETATGSVGALKRRAVGECDGEILVELDHDDLLARSAIAEVVGAFASRPTAGLVYSHTGQIDEHGDPLDTLYDDAHGWAYRVSTVLVADRAVTVRHALSMAPTPRNVGLVWYAPNHLRAFTRSTYELVGGYDPTRDVLDDHELMVRLYDAGPFVLIDRCLYLQRAHRAATQLRPELNARIQAETVEIHDASLERLAVRWAARQGLRVVDLDAGLCTAQLEDSSVGVVRANDVLTRTEDPVGLLNEIHRILTPGGYLLTLTASIDEARFEQLADPLLAELEPNLTARYQLARIVTYYPSTWHELHGIPYVLASLLALKPGNAPRNGGVQLWPVDPQEPPATPSPLPEDLHQ